MLSPNTPDTMWWKSTPGEKTKSTLHLTIQVNEGESVPEESSRSDSSGSCFYSDDRSAEVFQKRIDTATQMKSVLGVNEKPNCLIIDEIDGAPSVRSGHQENNVITIISLYNLVFNLWCSTGCHQHSASNAEQERRTWRRERNRDWEEEKEEGVHPASTNHLHL